MFAILELLWFLSIQPADIPSPPPQSYVLPLTRVGISSPYGFRADPITRAKRHHSGVDIPAPKGSLVRAIDTGVVVFADAFGGYGNLVVLRHGNGLTSHYGHLHDILTRPGREVTAGEIIGSVGSTGRSTGNHLHFELRESGMPLDPRHVLPMLH